MDTSDLARIARMERALNECIAATRDRETALPPGTAAGVLSEDAVYDAITALRDEAFRMLELATDILKNRI